jgi:hypothetical protein
MRNSKSKNTKDSLEKYFAFNRAPAIINYDRNDKRIVENREIGKVFAEYKDKLVVIDGENKKEHEYLIPKSKVDHYGDNKVYLSISENSLKEFEI